MMNLNFRVNVLIFTVIILACIFSCSQNNLSLEEKFQKTLNKGLQKYQVKGVSAAIKFPNQKILKVVSGISHDTISIKPDMLFAIGSITKNVVAALIMQLSEEGLLSLEDPLSKWLPIFPNVDSTITIRQLLNHTSGLYMFWLNQQIWDDLKKDRDKIWTPEEVLSYIKEPHFQPGEGYRYSNTNYLLLAMIITKATGSSLSTEMRNRFWEPLGIKHAYLSIEEEIPDKLAHVWGDNFDNDGSFRDITFLPRASHESISYGSAGLFMTAEDLANWSDALFQGKVLSRSSLEQMVEFNESGYGLGVGQFDRRFARGQIAFGHGGGNIGTTSFMIYLTEHNVSIAVMINAFHSSCLDFITKGLIVNILDELGITSFIPYFDFMPWRFFLVFGILTMIILMIIHTKRRMKKFKF